jgi:hypothetical protein
VITVPPRLRAAIAFLVLIVGCGRLFKVERRVVPPDQAQTLDHRSPYLKAHLRSGGVYVFSQWSWSDSTGRVAGVATLYDAARTRVDSGRVELSRDSVALFETNITKPSISGRALTVMAGVTAAAALACAANPKACFGSCPTFYAPDSTGRLVLQAEGFSASIAPALEATDIDALFRASASDRRFVLRVTNEALETHIIRRADLLVAPRPPNGRVFVTRDHRFIQASNLTPPSRCLAGEGECRVALAAFDGTERWSPADGGDLGAREFVDLEFDRAPSGPLALVVTARQSLMTTYLIYQALAYMGTNATRWLAAMQPSRDSTASAESILGRLLGTIEVYARSPSGDWSPVGETGETGPIAADTKLIPLTAQGDGPVRVRLRLTKGLWRLDWVALASLGSVVTPARLAPLEVLRAGVPDSLAKRHLLGQSDPLTTLPGDALDLVYELPPRPEQYDLFLDARGYYLEWMRREWFAEENPSAARRLLLDPAAMLRSLAPAYKRQEPDMERAFWGSRYVPR